MNLSWRLLLLFMIFFLIQISPPATFVVKIVKVKEKPCDVRVIFLNLTTVKMKFCIFQKQTTNF